MGGLIPDVVKLGSSLVNAWKNIDKVAHAAVETQRPLAQFSGRMASAYAQLEADRYGRSIQLSSNTAESTGELTRALSRLEESQSKWTAAGANVRNWLTAAVADFKASIIESINEMPIVKQLLNWLGGKDKPELPHMNRLALDIADGKFAGRKFPPLPERKRD